MVNVAVHITGFGALVQQVFELDGPYSREFPVVGPLGKGQD